MFGTRKTIRTLVLLGYCALVLFAGFLHTERTLVESKDCPACQFLRASIGTAPAAPEIPVVLALMGAAEASSVIGEVHAFAEKSISRAPPAV